MGQSSKARVAWTAAWGLRVLGEVARELLAIRLRSDQADHLLSQLCIAPFMLHRTIQSTIRAFAPGSLSGQLRHLVIHPTHAAQTDSLISLAFVKGLAVGVSLAKDTLGGSCRDSACLDHPVVKFFGVFSRPAIWVFHPLGRVATEIRAPHPWRVSVSSTCGPH